MTGFRAFLLESKFPKMPAGLGGQSLDDFLGMIARKFERQVTAGVPESGVLIHTVSDYLTHDGRKMPMRPVRIVVNKDLMGAGARWDQDRSIIHISEKTPLVQVRPKISHELAHVFDPKFKSADYSDRIYELGQDEFGRRYNLAPHEFDANCVKILHMLRQRMAEDDTLAARLGKLIRGDFDEEGFSAVTGIPAEQLPDINQWKTKPSLWRRFLQRLESILVSPGAD